MNISNQRELDRGNHQWLVANEEDHEDISDGSFKSDQSAHNALLPWYDPVHEAKTEDAIAYLDNSPAAKRALLKVA